MTSIPTDHLNSELRKLGRWMDDAEIIGHGWKDNEYGLQIVWADGFSAFVGMGPVASAQIEAFDSRKH